MGECAEVAIDPTPGEFKSCYFGMVQLRDGTYRVTSTPIGTSDEIINQASELGKRLINDATNATKIPCCAPHA